MTLTCSDNDAGPSSIVVVVLMLGNWRPSEVCSVRHLEHYCTGETTEKGERVGPVQGSGGTVVISTRAQFRCAVYSAPEDPWTVDPS